MNDTVMKSTRNCPQKRSGLAEQNSHPLLTDDGVPRARLKAFYCVGQKVHSVFSVRWL